MYVCMYVLMYVLLIIKNFVLSVFCYSYIPPSVTPTKDGRSSSTDGMAERAFGTRKHPFAAGWGNHTEPQTEERKAERGEEISSKTIWLKFRYIVFDLYSVLDYAYYFLYCHFSNGGQDAPIKDAVKISFPYKAKDGIAISDDPGKDQTKTFVTDHGKKLCRTNDPQKENP